jgi:glycosyltransferase involved in cell wall biosynthesis
MNEQLGTTDTDGEQREPATDVDGGVGNDADIEATLVSTPDDGSCGIGTYSGTLRDYFDDVRGEILAIEQDEQTVRHFLRLAVEAMWSESDVVHVQHEYGLFRRDGNPYPGVLGLVFFPVLFALNAVRQKTLVVTLHSVINPEPEDAPLRIRLYLELMHRLMAAGTDHLIFLSAECERDFRDDVPLSPTDYSQLPHGVDTQNASDCSTAVAKEEMGYDPDETVVAIPGFIRPPKGHDIFIEAAEEFPEYEFLVAGGGRPAGEDLDYAAEIEAEAPENVTVTGVLDDDDFPVALNSADLAFLPYREVSQSGTFNWCAAEGLPALTSEAAYFTRIEERWGNVETVDLQDFDAITDELGTLLEEESTRNELAENMRTYRRANSFDRVATMHRRIYTGSRVSESPTRETVAWDGTTSQTSDD